VPGRCQVPRWGGLGVPTAPQGDAGAGRGWGSQSKALLGRVGVCVGTEAPGGVRGGPRLRGRVREPSPSVGLRSPGSRVLLASVFVCLSVVPRKLAAHHEVLATPPRKHMGCS